MDVIYEAIVFNIDLDFANNDLDVVIGTRYEVVEQVNEVIYVYDNKEVLFGIDTSANNGNIFTLFEKTKKVKKVKK